MDLSVRRPTQPGEAIRDLHSRGITVTRVSDTSAAQRRALQPRADNCGEQEAARRELTDAERAELVRRCRDQLRAEESSLTLLRRVRHQQAKENVADQTPPAAAVKPAAGTPPQPQPAASTETQSAAGVLSGLLRTQTELSVSAQPVPTSVANKTNGKAGSGRSRTPQQPLPQQQRPASVEQQRSQQLQRQQLARLALRKQLEKSLLELPAPRPAASAGVAFVPSCAAGHFISMLGLESTVDWILDSGTRPQPHWENFRCGQCGVDFTPAWHVDSEGLSCDSCVRRRERRRTQRQHAERLKTAFVAAKQQEWELQEQLSQQERQLEARLLRQQEQEQKERQSLLATAPRSAPAPPTPETTITPVAPRRRPAASDGRRRSQPGPARSSGAPKQRAGRSEPAPPAADPAQQLQQLMMGQLMLQAALASQQQQQQQQQQRRGAQQAAAADPLTLQYQRALQVEMSRGGVAADAATSAKALSELQRQLLMSAAASGAPSPAALEEVQRQYMLALMMAQMQPQLGSDKSGGAGRGQK